LGRISYAEWLLQELIQSYPAEIKLHVMYDIACTLKKYMEVVFSPLRCDGLGLSDGEVMERLWSFLRRFSRMTKEMRPAHRADILSHALIYYGYKTKQKLDPVSEDMLQSWIRNEKDVILHSSSDSTLSWKTTYFLTLQSYYFLRDSLTVVK
jgi:hypothetical protein